MSSQLPCVEVFFMYQLYQFQSSSRLSVTLHDATDGIGIISNFESSRSLCSYFIDSST